MDRPVPDADPLTVAQVAEPWRPLVARAGRAGTNGAATLAQRVRSGETRAVDVVRASLDEARSWRHLNAFTVLDEDDVVRQAEALDARVREHVDPGPLAGVPVAIKDLMWVRGFPMSAGGSAFITNWFTKRMYTRCSHCAALNAKRRSHCRICATEL